MRTRHLVLVPSFLLLTGCSLVEGRASAVELCRDVESVLASAGGGTSLDPAALVSIEARLRVGVDDPDVQAAGGAFRAAAGDAAAGLRSGRSVAEVGPPLLESSGDLVTACEGLGVDFVR